MECSRAKIVHIMKQIMETLISGTFLFYLCGSKKKILRTESKSISSHEIKKVLCAFLLVLRKWPSRLDW